MAFTNVGPIVTIAQGQTVTWVYWFPENKDVGLQLAGADIHHPLSSSVAVAFDQGKRVIGFTDSGKVLQVEYLVSIRIADGDGPIAHNLQGGGVK
jgi:hypothetical protein